MNRKNHMINQKRVNLPSAVDKLGKLVVFSRNPLNFFIFPQISKMNFIPKITRVFRVSPVETSFPLHIHKQSLDIKWVFVGRSSGRPPS
jgi:hypothetical protein